MIPLSDGIPARRFPVVNVSLIVANFAVWIFYELPHLSSSVHDASFYPCAVNGSCHVPNLGASGAIAAVLGAYFVLYPESRVLTLVFVFLVRIPAWVFLGVWFLYQLFEGNFGIFSAPAHGGGTAFFAHIGGFLFGLLVARLLAGARARAPATAAA
jgi:membrane associated rhomboid family serine protease